MEAFLQECERDGVLRFCKQCGEKGPMGEPCHRVECRPKGYVFEVENKLSERDFRAMAREQRKRDAVCEDW